MSGASLVNNHSPISSRNEASSVDFFVGPSDLSDFSSTTSPLSKTGLNDPLQVLQAPDNPLSKDSSSEGPARPASLGKFRLVSGDELVGSIQTRHTVNGSSMVVLQKIFVPSVLAIWGLVLFLRFGVIISQAGFLLTLGMLALGYSVSFFTALSQNAIATNGSFGSGGLYYFISRTLGPEFGATVGLILFSCYVVSSGMYIIGFREPLMAAFGENTGIVFAFLPTGRWWFFLYDSLLLLFCVSIAAFGCNLYNKASLIVFLIMTVSTFSIILSFFFQRPFELNDKYIYYTSFNSTTFRSNFLPKFDPLWNGGNPVGFNFIFSLLYNACSGIISSADLSELKNPGRAMTRGTFTAMGVTFCIYVIMALLISSTTDRLTLYARSDFLQFITMAPSLFFLGVFVIAMFSSIDCFLGAVFVLGPPAIDRLHPFFAIFRPGATRQGSLSPWIAILCTWMVTQLSLFIGDLNLALPFASMASVLVYACLNLACLALELSGAPNFRPTFKFFKWWTAALGFLLCLIVMFVIDTVTASLLIALVVCCIFYFHFNARPKPWGDITQSLIYHQVRKYLLRLDIRKSHVKYWRPQILLLVKDPRTSFQLILFCNALKKGALYVLGHVLSGEFHEKSKIYQSVYYSWLQLVDTLKIKAFVEMTISPRLLYGARHLMMGSGLGGMKSNIVLIEFQENYDSYGKMPAATPQFSLSLNGPEFGTSIPDPVVMQPLKPLRFLETVNNGFAKLPLYELPTDDDHSESSDVSPSEYVAVLSAAIELHKSIAIARSFNKLDRPLSLKEQSTRSCGLSTTSKPNSASSSDCWNTSMETLHDLLRKPLVGPSDSSIGSFTVWNKCKRFFLNDRKLRVAPPPVSATSSASVNEHNGVFLSFNDVGTSLMPPTLKYIDLWPIQSTQPNLSSLAVHHLETYTLILQMGTILHMVPFWHKHFRLRVLVFVDRKEQIGSTVNSLTEFLEQLRIAADAFVVSVEEFCQLSVSRTPATHASQPPSPLQRPLSSSITQSPISASLPPSPPFSPLKSIASHAYANRSRPLFNDLPEMEQIKLLNDLISYYSRNAVVVMTALLPPPVDPDDATAIQYLRKLDVLTRDWPSTLLIYGRGTSVSTSI